MLLASIQTRGKFLSIIAVCSAFLSIQFDEDNVFLSLIVKKKKKKKKFTWDIMSQGLTENSYFSQILETDLDDIKFPRVSL